MSKASELAALRRRAQLDNDESAQIRAAIDSERARAVSDAEKAASQALTLTKPLSLPPSAITLATKVATFLEEEAGKDESGYNRLQRIMRNMAEIAESKSPKAVEAARFCIEYGYGKPRPSDEALDAIAKGGVQIVYVAAPEVPAGEERRALPTKPDFIDAEFNDD